MIQNIKKNFFFLLLFLTIFLIHQYIFQQFFSNFEGYLGHDYEQHLPNLMFGKIWFSKNFLSIPWFTPSFCCGIPFFGDPQSMYYSLQQIIFLIFSPTLSLKIIFFSFSIIGYLSMFLLMRNVFKFDVYTALLCSCLFLFNGFFIYRAIAGHLAYISYIFVPLYCYFLLKSQKNNNNLNYVYLILSSFVLANFFHSGSGPIILIIFASILTVILFYSFFFNNLKIFYNFFISMIFGILISLSKITASLFFLSNFPRNYPPTEFLSFFSYIKIFFSSFFLKPDLYYFNSHVKSMFPFGMHETEYGISLVPIILVTLFLLLNIKNFQLKNINIKFLILIVGIFLTPLFLNLNFLNQFILIQKIPILNSTWVQFRWMAIYILPLIIICGIMIEKINIKIKHKKYLIFFLIFILLSQNTLRDQSWHLEDQKYSIKNITNFNLKFGKGIKPVINGPAVLVDKSNSPKKINFKKYLIFFLIFILLSQNTLRDQSWHLEDQKYSIKNITNFNLKFGKGIKPVINGPAVLVDKSNSPKKINSKNDMFLFSLFSTFMLSADFWLWT